MKKGDLMKREILKTAEDLFCKYGFEQTSIQDILDVLHSSKGSFYHHFESKETLLAEICRKRADEIHLTVFAEIEKKNTLIEKLNLLLTGIIPFQSEKTSFILMLLHIFNSQHGKTVVSAFCDSLSSCFSSDLSGLLSAGSKSGELYCTEPVIMSDICLTLIHRLWRQICKMIISSEMADEEVDLSEIQHINDQYRRTLENALVLPYGSLELISLSFLDQMISRIHVHWNDVQKK